MSASMNKQGKSSLQVRPEVSSTEYLQSLLNRLFCLGIYSRRTLSIGDLQDILHFLSLNGNDPRQTRPTKDGKATSTPVSLSRDVPSHDDPMARQAVVETRPGSTRDTAPPPAQRSKRFTLNCEAFKSCPIAWIYDAPLADSATELRAKLNIRLWSITMKHCFIFSNTLTNLMPIQVIRYQHCRDVPEDVGAFIDTWKELSYPPRKVNRILRSENIVIPLEYVLRRLGHEADASAWQCSERDPNDDTGGSIPYCSNVQGYLLRWYHSTIGMSSGTKVKTD